LKGDRGSRAHGVFAASSVSAQPGVGGTSVRAPPQVNGPLHLLRPFFLIRTATSGGPQEAPHTHPHHHHHHHHPQPAHPPQGPGPGHYVPSADAAHVQACGRQVLSTRPTSVAAGLSAASALDAPRAALVAAAHAQQAARVSWPDRGPTAVTLRGAQVTNATLGVRQPSSTLANAPTFTFTDKVSQGASGLRV
jgi:hypothetical protein